MGKVVKPFICIPGSNACEGHERVVVQVEEEVVLGASSTDDLSQEKLAQNKRRRKVHNKKKNPPEDAQPAEGDYILLELCLLRYPPTTSVLYPLIREKCSEINGSDANAD